MELISLHLVHYNQCSPGILLLHHFTHHHWSHYQALYLAINQTLVHMPTFYLQTLLSRFLFWSPKPFSQRIVCQWSRHSRKSGVHPIYMLVKHYVGWYFSILAAESFNFLPGLPRPSQKGKHWIQYELDVAFYRTLYDTSALNTNFWAIPHFLLDLTCFLTVTRSPVSNYVTRLTFVAYLPVSQPPLRY